MYYKNGNNGFREKAATQLLRDAAAVAGPL